MDRQTDRRGKQTSFGYAAGATTVTDPRGNTTIHRYSNGQLTSLTSGAGTGQEATWSYGYDQASFGRTRVTDPNGHWRPGT